MSQFYSNPARERDAHALPDCECFQLTAEEVAASAQYEDEQFEFMRRHEFRLASMNGRTRDAMLAAMIEELSIEGGWFYWYCLPGCMPDSEAIGPYPTAAHARAACREDASAYPDTDEECTNE